MSSSVGSKSKVATLTISDVTVMELGGTLSLSNKGMYTIIYMLFSMLQSCKDQLRVKIGEYSSQDWWLQLISMRFLPQTPFVEPQKLFSIAELSVFS